MRAAALFALTLSGFAAAAEELRPAPSEPDDYRLAEYRSPTPLTLRGAKVLDTALAETLWRSHSAAFVDVLPQAPRPANLPPGTLWRDKPRPDIPGSLWLPDTGYGELAPIMLGYFSNGLKTASHGDLSYPLVFYCLADCWMSWNAARRAVSLGYLKVSWYRDGTDGWFAAGLPLSLATPEPRPPS